MAKPLRLELLGLQSYTQRMRLLHVLYNPNLRPISIIAELRAVCCTNYVIQTVTLDIFRKLLAVMFPLYCFVLVTKILSDSVFMTSKPAIQVKEIAKQRDVIPRKAFVIVLFLNFFYKISWFISQSSEGKKMATVHFTTRYHTNLMQSINYKESHSFAIYVPVLT